MENNNNNNNEHSECYIRVVKGNENNSASSFVSGAVAGFFVTTLIVGIVKTSFRVLTD